MFNLDFTNRNNVARRVRNCEFRILAQDHSLQTLYRPSTNKDPWSSPPVFASHVDGQLRLPIRQHRLAEGDGDSDLLIRRLDSVGPRIEGDGYRAHRRN